MKKALYIFAMLIASTALSYAQWEPIPVGSGSAPITSMYTYLDTLFVAAHGEGLFKTTDNGANWTNVSGDLANLNINDIRGGTAPTATWVSTDDGIYFTMDQQSFVNNTSTGLSNTNVNYYWFGPDDDWAVGTFGGGIYTSEEMSGPWNPANNGITGDGLYVNDLGGYSDGTDDYSCLASEGGVYFTEDDFATWTAKNNGLSGDALKVKRLTGVGTYVMIATHGGLFSTYDLGDNWLPLVPEEKFNAILAGVHGSGIICFAFGESGYYSLDLINWTPIDMGPIDGEVLSVAFNSTEVFIGVETTGKDGLRGGGIYRQPIDIITSKHENQALTFQGKLLPNFPNPAGDRTNIRYTLHSDVNVRIDIFDIHGKLIQTLVNEQKGKGIHEIVLHTNDWPSNMYFYSLSINGQRVSTRKMMID